jgi:hypothetical protein
MVSTIRVVTILIRGIIDRANNFVVGAIKNREGIKKKDRTMGELAIEIYITIGEFLDTCV